METRSEMRWTQDEAIAFECAREAINHVIAIYSSEIYNEEKKETPDNELLETLNSELFQLTKELKALRLADNKNIAETRKKYSAIVKNKREGKIWR